MNRTNALNYKDILDSSDAICITALNKEVIYTNKAFDDYFGTFDKFGQDPALCSEIKPGEHCNTDDCPLKQIESGELLVVQQVTKQDVNEVERCFRISSRPFHSDDGQLVGIIQTFDDVSKIREAEQEVVGNMVKYRELFENTTSAVAVYEPVDDGRDFRILDFNRKAEEINQISRDEVIGKLVTEAFPAVGKFGLFKVFQEVYETGEPKEHPVELYQDDRLAAWMENYVYKLPTGIIVAIHDDVTVQKQAELKLVKSESKYRYLFSTMAQGVVYHDAEGAITSANEAATNILGLSHDQLMGKTSMDPRWHSIDEDGKPVLGENHPDVIALKTGEPVNDVIMGVFVPEREEYRWIKVNAVPQFEDGNSKPIGVFVTFDDFTERKHVEDRLAEANFDLEEAMRDIQTFSHTVAHDLKNPINNIRNSAKLILDEYSEMEDADKLRFLTKISETTEKMSQLIDDIMAFSLVAKDEIRVSETNIANIAKEVLVNLIESDPDRMCSYEIDPEIILPCDPGLMRVVLENLLGNAWKFTSNKEEAVIKVAQEIIDSQQVVSVSDNGAGFPPEMSSQLFEPFQRLHSEREFKGTGVGLATVARILDRHKGKIWAKSDGETGATFYFTIPR